MGTFYKSDSLYQDIRMYRLQKTVHTLVLMTDCRPSSSFKQLRISESESLIKKHEKVLEIIAIRKDEFIAEGYDIEIINKELQKFIDYINEDIKILQKRME